MAKKKVTIEAGRYREIYTYTPPMPNDNERTRAERSKITTEAQNRINHKTARKTCTLLMYCNFNKYDLFVTLSYDDNHRPKNRKDAKRELRKYLRALREIRKKRGHDLKYIYATEDKHTGGNIHHHIIINATDKTDFETIISLWSNNSSPQGVDIEYIAAGKTDGRSFEDLAKYITKEKNEEKPNGAQMFTTSRNLNRPRKRSEWIKDNETITAPANAIANTIISEHKQNQWGSFDYISYFLSDDPERTEPVQYAQSCRKDKTKHQKRARK